MNISEFTQRLVAVHPGATCWRTIDVSGAPIKSGITITYQPEGKFYHYRGTFQSIAIHLHLVTEYVIWCAGSVCGSELSESAAIAKCAELTARDVTQCAKWGGNPQTYTYQMRT